MTGEGTMAMEAAPRGFTPVRALFVSALIWLVAFGLASQLPPPGSRHAALIGVAAGVVSSLGGLLVTWLTAGGTLNQALLGRVVASIGRMFLVAAGVIATGGAFQHAMSFVLAFFPLFFASTILEHFVSVPGKPPAGADSSQGAH